MKPDPRTSVAGRQPVPRGIAVSGPAILSYGFRPFFLAAGTFAVLSMILWIGALSAGWEFGGHYGPIAWHAHELLFGYTSAALAGFMLTAIPNWTGRLPVSGLPLLAPFVLWLLGRGVMLGPDLLGAAVSAAVDAAFLPVLALIAAREIIAGRNWKNLKILLGLLALAGANIWFHVAILAGGEASMVYRGTISIYVMLIALVGGRMVPSFTRNWLAKAGAVRLPRPFGRFDLVAIVAMLAALAAWTVAPDTLPTAVAALGAALLQAVRLWRWRGWTTLEEPLLLVMHLGYGFVPLGLVGVGLAALGWLSGPSALHLLTVGAIGIMTLAVMTRATLGHTGRPLTASAPTALAYLALVLAAVLRPFAEVLPGSYHLLLAASAAGWIAAFTGFVLVYGPMLVSARRPRSAAAATPPQRAKDDA